MTNTYLTTQKRLLEPGKIIHFVQLIQHTNIHVFLNLKFISCQSTMQIIFMIYSLIEINLIGERALQRIQIMSSYGNKSSSAEK